MSDGGQILCAWLLTDITVRSRLSLMATHSVSLAPDRVIEWSDRDDLPLDTYCADVNCAPKSECDSCLLRRWPDCDCCQFGASVTIIHPGEGLPALAVCLACALEDAAAMAADREVSR